MTVKQLEAAVGTLGNPSKMPGFSWGIPAKHCNIGSKLREIKGSTCHDCYACKGRYVFPNVQNALQTRLDAFYAQPYWADLMAELIGRKSKREHRWFRWFDSGDLQGESMLEGIIMVALRLPLMNFWLSTQERGIVKRVNSRMNTPGNLRVRISSTMVGTPQHSEVSPFTTSVKQVKDKARWAELVKANTSANFHCPAPLQNNNCGNCRACWSLTYPQIIYRKH